MTKIGKRTKPTQVHEGGLGAECGCWDQNRRQEEGKSFCRLRNERAVTLIKALPLSVDKLCIAGVVPEVEGMRRGRDCIGPVVHPKDDGLQQEEVAEDLFGVLAEALIQRLVVVAQRTVERLVRRDELQQ